MPISSAARWVTRRIFRAPGRSLLIMLVAGAFAVGLAYLDASIHRTQDRIDELFETVEVKGTILRTSSEHIKGSGFLRSDAADAIYDTGFLKSVNLEAGGEIDVSFRPEDEKSEDPEASPPRKRVDIKDFVLNAVEVFTGSTAASNYGPVEYAEGFDEESVFRDGAGVVLASTGMERLGAKLGETIYLHFSERIVSEVTIAGVVSSAYDGPRIFMGVDLCRELSPQHIFFYRYDFVIDPAQNRSLADFTTQVENILANARNLSGTRLLIMDDELTQVLEPLERSLPFMRALNTVLCVVSALIAAGLALLLCVQMSRESALLRMLGVRRGTVSALCCAEQALVCILGLVLGLALSRLIPATMIADPTKSLLYAGLYLVATLAGAFFGSTVATGKMPLELLQVKE